MDKNPIEQACRTCRYWSPGPNERTNDYGDGECRRHAPTAQLLIRTSEHGRSKPQWPETSALQWCGDWKEFVIAGRPHE